MLYRFQQTFAGASVNFEKDLIIFNYGHLPPLWIVLDVCRVVSDLFDHANSDVQVFRATFQESRSSQGVLKHERF